MTDSLAHIPTLTTERLILRAPLIEDFQAYAEFYAGDGSVPVGGPLSMRDAWQRFCADLGHWALRGFGWWTIDDRTGPVGTCGIHAPPSHEEPELGWLLFARGRGQGFATEAARCARDWWLSDNDRLTSNILYGNTASEAVARRLGATPGRAPTHNADAIAWLHRAGA
ncbi:GNAT family N-acetyltransferase [Jannaschia marina]|uniref:GNAT family N-acetyltransferase n=1 Tax=Jannaschia marina TaxID=2741674 RepID=UPI0015CD455A|nr:GNAT family N-acetyltransferase [Jannaschia marina]